MTAHDSSMHSSDLALGIGHVVLAASDTEDAAGTLLRLLASDDKAASAWWSSGTGLVDALVRLNQPRLATIIDRLSLLTQQRNLVVHGTWLTAPDGTRMLMKRSKVAPDGTREPTYAFAEDVDIAKLDALAGFYRELHTDIEHEISIALGLS